MPRRVVRSGRPPEPLILTVKTVEDALDEVMDRFGVQQEEVTLEVVEEGKSGLLGLGAKPYRVKVTLKEQAVAFFAERLVARFLREMDLPGRVQRKTDPDGFCILNIEGSASGVLIGRRGQTLEAFQYLVTRVLQRLTGLSQVRILVDVEGYRQRQREKLIQAAHRAAEKAIQTGTDVILRPMNARDRRIVHLALRSTEEVETQSIGEGDRRRVMIIPKKRKNAGDTEREAREELQPSEEVFSSSQEEQRQSDEGNLPSQA